MPFSSRRRRFARALVALILAAVTGGRGGGIALACESIGFSASAEWDAMADMPGMSQHATPHDATSGDGCDSEDRTRECPLMLACAPALLTAVSDSDSTVVASASIIEWRTGSPTSALGQPEPPPPRA